MSLEECTGFDHLMFVRCKLSNLRKMEVMVCESLFKCTLFIDYVQYWQCTCFYINEPMKEFILYGCAASFLTSNGNCGFKILYLLCILTWDLFWRDMCMHHSVLVTRHLCTTFISFKCVNFEASYRVGTFLFLFNPLLFRWFFHIFLFCYYWSMFQYLTYVIV